MKLKPILTALAVALAALAQPALAGFQFTQNEKGEVTHYNGIELPPIQTVEEAKAQAQKEIAAAMKAREAQQAEQPANPPQEVFFTGKPYLEETGQYLFLFRHYDPELARWTTADPSGFPDGANNLAYMAVPTMEFDWQGLKSVAWVVAWTSLIDASHMANTHNELQASFHIVRQGFVTSDSQTAGTPGATHYLDDGDSFDFFSVASSFDFASPSITAYDRIYLAAHGNPENGHFFIGGQSFSREMVLGFSQNIFMLQGCGNGYIETHELVLQHFYPLTRDYLRE